MGDIVKKRSRDGRFLGWYIRYVDAQGIRRQRATHEATFAGARKKLIEVEAAVLQGVDAGSGPATIAELVETFLAEFRSPRIKDLAAYRANARRTLNRLMLFVGHLRLETLDRRALERVRDELSARHRPNTVRASLIPLSTALSWAMRQGWIRANPMRTLDLPRPERSLERLTQDEAAKLLRTAEELTRKPQHELQKLQAQSQLVAVTLALRLGLRRGECFGLRWQDVDLAAPRATICRSYSSTVKTGKPRHLPLPADVAALVRTWRDVCPQTDAGVVCPKYCSRTGWQMGSKSEDAGLRKLGEQAGLRRWERGWHCLRHSMASAFCENGGSLYALQTILGHSDPKVTQIYAHLSPTFLAQELERVKF